MGQLSEIEVLYALSRESTEKNKRINMRKSINFSDIVRRIETEHPDISSKSIPVLVARYLKKLKKSKLITKEKKGRETLYTVTPSGRIWLGANMDKLDKTKRWFEKSLEGVYLSYSMQSPEHGLIKDRNDQDVFENTRDIEELLKKIKKINPELDTIIIRLKKQE